ncbi:FAD dependent oxidoreductase-domain-containing protein [Macrophomina phaseolina]|uniref:FAD dependent oxidoreductase-domain-containing protein n=1 Tax=Macrophomina phaseolina TaxID=35725 RepID=A0ABQ8FYD3_9PEZI|nr:FAD dependent oxidoreductase-domain-containing protein [Macrophomina phaseolina]
MGNVLSSIKGTYQTICVAAKALLALNANFQEVLARASRDPGLPARNPTSSYWLDDPPFPHLVDARSEEFPEHADVAIIGSGITAAAVARSLLLEAVRRDDALPRVVVLEARQLTSGATGRNGGHIKPASYADYALLKQKFGPDRAAAIVRFQRQHLTRLPELCRAEHIDLAECRDVETIDLFLDTPSFDKYSKEVEELRNLIPEAIHTISDRKEAQEKFHAGEHVVGAISYRAGALWPYRFVASIWRSLLSQFPTALSIETTTPVQSISSASEDSDPYPFHLHTPRGTLRARQVVHATNAFAGHLVPGLRAKMTGLRAHMSAQRPGAAFPSDARGERSWSIMYGAGFDYMTQRPSSPSPQSSLLSGDLMLGGGFFRSPEQGLDQMGVWDDSQTDALTATHLNGILPAVFGAQNWGVDAPEGRLVKMWSGTICFTADAVPFVGKLDPRLTGRAAPSSSKQKQQPGPEPGEWIAAGYHGDGMIYAWLCGTAVGLMLAGSEEEDVPERPGQPGGRVAEWLPRELRVTYERVRKISLADLAGELE